MYYKCASFNYPTSEFLVYGFEGKQCGGILNPPVVVFSARPADSSIGATACLFQFVYKRRGFLGFWELLKLKLGFPTS